MVAVADRRSLGMKDMAMTMVVVLVVAGLIALYQRNVSFSPGAQVTVGETPTADVVNGFRHAKTTLSFPIVVPAGLPEDWHPNSLTVSDPTTDNLGVTKVGTVPTVRGGWITPAGAFIMLIEAGGTVDQVVAGELGETRPATGEIEAGGATWTVTTGVRDEVAWLRTAEGADGVTTFLITGNAPEADFRTLAAAVAD